MLTCNLAESTWFLSVAQSLGLELPCSVATQVTLRVQAPVPAFKSIASLSQTKIGSLLVFPEATDSIAEINGVQVILHFARKNDLVRLRSFNA